MDDSSSEILITLQVPVPDTKESIETVKEFIYVLLTSIKSPLS